MSDDPLLIDSQKLSLHPTRVAQWLAADTPEKKLAVYPIYVEISPVGHCNHRCTFCAVDYIGYKARSIDTMTLMQCLTQMSNKGVKSVMFAGEGEPLLHKEIDLLVKCASSVGIDVAFTTNGVLLDKIYDVLDRIKWIKVSLNAGNEEDYERIHKAKKGDWGRVWENLQGAVRRRKEFTKIGVQAVVLPDNIQSLESLVRIAKATCLDYVVLKPYSQHTSSLTKEYKEVTYHEQLQGLLTLKEKYETAVFKVIVRTTAMEDWDAQEHKYKTCHATPYMWAYIMATGDVYSCSAYLLNNEFNLGNINEQSFSSIWEGAKRRSHLTYMATLDISKCRLNCRMNQVNKYLDKVVNPPEHASFI